MCSRPYLLVGVLTKFYNSIGKVCPRRTFFTLNYQLSKASFVLITICFVVNLEKIKEIFDMDWQLPLGRRQQWSLETGR